MQQLFGLINEVLAHSPATAKRRLRIVTYKVILCASCMLRWAQGCGVYATRACPLVVHLP